MSITIGQYVPILKWRQGEYQALLRLPDPLKDSVIPLLVIPPIEFDFEERRLKKTTQGHIETFPKRFQTKWGKRKALIDIHDSLEGEVMDDGAPVVNFLFDELRKGGSTAIPVIRLSRTDAFIMAVKQIATNDQNGICFRIKLPELMKSSELNLKTLALLKVLDLDYSQVDLVLDLDKPQSFEPYPEFSKALTGKINKIAGIREYRSFTVASTSLQLSTIKQPGGEIIRHEWQLYKQLVRDLSTIRVPSYGDYSIETPEFSELDMRQIKPAGKIVYTGNDVWYVAKGKAFRGNESQMINHCKSIINSVHWCESDYSLGDKRISDTASGIENCGNLSTWKQVGVLHHLVKVAEQLSKFHAS